MILNINNDWKDFIEKERNKNYFKNLEMFLAKERKEHTIYPKEENVFNAYALTPFSQTKVVIIGQDPYHGENQAHGLCFSVLPNNKIPPSLRNIYKELHADCHCKIPNHGYLRSWAKQGVLMINSVMTVRAGHANSHKKKGWEDFTTAVIKKLNQKSTATAFILWGNYAQKYEKYLNNPSHLIIKSYHPSPLSASRGFFGTKPFSRVNQYLLKNNATPIDWCV